MLSVSVIGRLLRFDRHPSQVSVREAACTLAAGMTEITKFEKAHGIWSGQAVKGLSDRK